MKSRVHNCIVLDQKIKAGRLGKHEAHPAHDWWYTSWGGGHQLHDDWKPTQIYGGPDGWDGWDETEKWVAKWHCPGIKEN